MLSGKDIYDLNTMSLSAFSAKLGDVLRDVEGKIDTFSSNPVQSGALGAVPTGTAGDVNVLFSGKGMYELCIKGTQTITAPAWTSAGVNIGAMDQTANDGIEITNGVTSSSPKAFVVGASEFYGKCKISIADVSGTDDCAFGFRKAEAYQANIDDYADMACLNIQAGTVNLETILASAATVTVDTTYDVADTEYAYLELKVDLNGKVYYRVKVNTTNETTWVLSAFTFAAATVVVPFLFFLQDTDIAGAVNVSHWEVGLV